MDIIRIVPWISIGFLGKRSRLEGLEFGDEIDLDVTVGNTAIGCSFEK